MFGLLGPRRPKETWKAPATHPSTGTGRGGHRWSDRKLDPFEIRGPVAPEGAESRILIGSSMGMVVLVQHCLTLRSGREMSKKKIEQVVVVYKAFLWLSPNPRACLHTAPVFSCSTNNKALPNPSTTQAPPEPFDTGTGRGSAPRPVTRAAVFPAEAFTREIIDSTASRRRASRVSASDALARSTKVTNRVQGNQSPPGPRKLMDPYHLLMMFMCFFVCLILLGVFSANPVRLKSPCPGMYHAQFDGEGGQATLPTTNVVSWTENPLFDLCRGERP